MPKATKKEGSGPNPSRSWCVTWNNPPAAPALTVGEKNLRYAVWQLEEGEECGTPHFQMYLEFDKPVRMAAVKALLAPEVHCEVRRGTREEARDYCRKEESRKEGPWEVGTWTGGQGARSDLAALMEIINGGGNARDAWHLHPELMFRYYRGFNEARLALQGAQQRPDIHVKVLYGESGTGKTREAERLAAEFEAEGKAVYRKAPGKWWDGYNGEEVVIMDEFYGSWMHYAEFLRLIDRYPLSVECKGGTIPMRACTIIITSNSEPALWYPNIVEKLPVLRRLHSITHYRHGFPPKDVTEALLQAARSAHPQDFSSFFSTSK